MTTINASDHIAQIVTSHPACAALFTEHKIDFCCHGEVALEEVCKTRGLDVQDFLSRLRAAACAVAQDGAQDMSGASTAELIAHIVSRHHTYLRRSLPALEPLVAKVARVHGEHNPKLRGLVDELRELRQEIEPHMDEEEAEIFPMMMMNRNGDHQAILERLGDVRREHESVGQTLGRIRALSDDFSVPDWGCGSYRMMMSELATLESDTLRHVHLENHVLMPRFGFHATKPKAAVGGSVGATP